jgi:asparagine synthase (glutamine-hydrolysing)
MCGIAGYFSPKRTFFKEDLQKMTDCLAHRGPDAAGYFSDEVCGLGNRRLKVIDLSDSANQPMYSDGERYVIVYNGEVYNYKEVAEEIKSQNKSVVFKTSSDTEVILKAFIEFGEMFVEKLNGMFAIAIYDRLKKILYLYRDRLGIKPLYIFSDVSNFAFASELKALTLLKQIPFKINAKAVYSFLHLGYIPGLQSIYKDIYKVDAGCYYRIKHGRQELKRYWYPENKMTNKIVKDESTALTKLEELLTSSVRYQMKSDVPYGIFLSGGIDSSLITSVAVELSGDKVNTFSIGFEEAQYNEAEHAKKVAAHLKTAHHEFIVSYKDALPLVDKMIEAYDEPFADSSAIPAMLVSKMARQHVTVALSGEGGDELFFGYGAYKWAGTLSNPLWRALHKPVSAALSLFPETRYQKASGLFDYRKYSNIRSHIFSQEQHLFSENELRDILMPEYVPYLFFLDDYYYDLKRRRTAAEKQALFDLHYYLPDDLLVKMDRASMLYSLEARVPYLDHRLVEFALNLSPKLKVKNGVTKYLLKQLLYKKVPKEYFDRRKQGFSIPLATWLQNELRYLIDEYLDKTTIERFGIVKYEVVRDMKEDFFAGKTFLYNRLWLLIVLHKWLDGRDIAG